MKKYDVRFCSCGTLHFLDNETSKSVFFTSDNVLAEKEIIQVCLHCGITLISGLSEYDYDDETGRPTYSHYSRCVNESIDNPDPSKYYVILSKGVRLMMQSGGYADSDRGDVYVDEEGLVRQLGHSDLTQVQELRYSRSDSFHKLHDVRAINVNMAQLFKDITPEQAESLCGYYHRSFNWLGTPYEKDFHSAA